MIIYLGCIIPDIKLLKWQGTSAAANAFQKTFISYFEKYDKEIFSIVSNALVRNTQLENGLIANLIIKPKGKIGNIIVFIKTTWLVLRKSRNGNRIIQFNPEYYSLLLPYICAIKKTESILILSDFTEPEEVKGLLRRWMAKRIKNTILHYTKIIVLSNTLLVNSHNRYLIYRGSINIKEFSGFSMNRGSDKIKLLFSGTYNDVGGVNILLQAFSEIDNSDLELHFTGYGELKNTIKIMQENDTRIIDHGFVTRQELLEIYREVSILVNPRDMRITQNKNNFPSKILEYLATGRLIISTMFSGWEDFTSAQIIFCESNLEALRQGILQTIEMFKMDANKAFAINRNIANYYSIENSREVINDFILK